MEIKIYKPWNEYTAEEKEILPKISNEVIKKLEKKYGFVPMCWNGRNWVLALEAVLWKEEL